MFEVQESVLLILAGDKTCKQTYKLQSDSSVTDLSKDVPTDKTEERHQLLALAQG